MLESFFSPKSVAVIGASHTPGKIGYTIVENFVNNKFPEKVYPINPDTTPILNLEVFSSIKNIKEKIDLVIIAVPAASVLKVLKECVSKKIESIIIISSGFSEIGEQGKKIEEECKKIIFKTKTRVIGPNCIGTFDSSVKFDMMFQSQDRMKRPPEGNISFISQSGAVGSTILDWLAEEKIGIAKFVSYGNGMDLTESDLLDFLANDKKTKVIVMYLEGIKSDGKRFIETMKKITKKKPVIILKAGKTEKGTKAVASHTGSLAGSAKIYSSVFKQTGAIEAESWEELFDYAKAFSTQPLPKNNRLVIITDGGGFGVLATDECERQKLQLTEPSKALKTKLQKQFPSYVILHNPIDLTGDATAERYKIALEECLRGKEYDGSVVISLFQIPTLEEKVVNNLIEMKKFDKPILCCAVGGKFTRRLSEKLETSGIPVYPTPERAVKSFAVLTNYSKK
jgi:acetyl coenzyme A synthetase (ADP forming)-like protein